VATRRLLLLLLGYLLGLALLLALRLLAVLGPILALPLIPLVLLEPLGPYSAPTALDVLHVDGELLEIGVVQAQVALAIGRPIEDPLQVLHAELLRRAVGDAEPLEAF